MLPDPLGGLVPLANDSNAEVSIYVCGITPYDATHLGHAATYLLFDILIRAIRDSGRKVKFVENVTDVDDPLFERAKQTGVNWLEISRNQTALFVSDMTSLRVIPPDAFVLTSNRIDQTADLVKRLTDKGVTYQIGIKIYLDLGALTLLPGIQDIEMEALLELFANRGGDPEVIGKRHQLDPVIWVLTDEEPSWPTVVGQGRPGWHVECVSIIESFLGLPIDIQGGGKDLEFPHHQMCDSTVNQLNGGHLANHYVHSGLISLDGEKMSKSLGNLVFVSRLLAEGVEPMALRLALLDRDWQEELNWTSELLDASHGRLRLWLEVMHAETSNTNELGKAKGSYHSEASADALGRLQGIRIALAAGLNLKKALDQADQWASALNGEGPSSDSDRYLFGESMDSLFGVKLTK